MKKLEQMIRDWMLPGAIVLGISLYLVYHFSPALRPIGPACHVLASHGQRLVIALLLFFQFVKVPPRSLHMEKWYLGAAVLQIGCFLACAGGILLAGDSPFRIPLECAMLCFICPTASAAGVITDRLGGNLSATISYLLLINLAATLLIPLVVPLVNPSSELSFWMYVWHLALRIFPVLILPCLFAWLVMFTMPKIHAVLVKWSRNAFYIWGIGLTLAMVLSTRSLILSQLPAWVIVTIVAVSAGACFIQFFAGRLLGHHSDNITAGQALGQKNTGFLIWLGYNYFTPVTSVAGGLYAIWQNLFNSWELYRKEHRPDHLAG